MSEKNGDPIVAEVRRARAEYAKEFNYDLAAMCRDLQRRTEEARRAGRKVVSVSRRRVRRRTKPAKVAE